MDAKLSEVFATLKTLFSTHNSGAQWSSGAKPRPRPQAGPVIEFQAGATEADIVNVAEETRLFALGLGGQYRFKRRDSFSCSASLIAEGEQHRLGASMVIDGRQCYLQQTLAAGPGWLIGQRTLLAWAEHVGRKVKVGHKVRDGMNYQLIHEERRRYTIVRHGAGWLELERPLQSNLTGYLCLIFE